MGGNTSGGSGPSMFPLQKLQNQDCSLLKYMQVFPLLLRIQGPYYYYYYYCFVYDAIKCCVD